MNSKFRTWFRTHLTKSVLDFQAAIRISSPTNHEAPFQSLQFGTNMGRHFYESACLEAGEARNLSIKSEFDMHLASMFGHVVLQPPVSDGYVGIGVTNPVAKLDVNVHTKIRGQLQVQTVNAHPRSDSEQLN